jgi:ribosomal protein L40E
MRYLAYAVGIVLKAAGFLLVLTAAILWVRGRPSSEILFDTGAVCFSVGFLLKRASRLKKCFRCREKVAHDASRCRHCGSDLPANAAESLSEPFYK